MKYAMALVMVALSLVLFSCRKEHNPNEQQNPPDTSQQPLLKDVKINTIPEPWYHFDYNTDKKVIAVTSQSSLDTLHVFYDGDRIRELRNDVTGNHDTLRYTYDNSGHVSMITVIGAGNFSLRHIFFTYAGQQLKEITWDYKEGNGFITDRQLSYTYYPDGNVKQFTDHYPPLNGQPEVTYSTLFEQYDDKVNTDGFSRMLFYNDHFFILPGIVIQKNNPGKETRTGDATHYIIDWSYQYRNDGIPTEKTGNVRFLTGPEAGKTFVTKHAFTYY
jgi:hypothetical protein